MASAECKLQMLDLFFSKFSFSQERGKNSSEYKYSFGIEYSVSKADKSKIRVTIDTSVHSKDDSIILDLETVGLFRIDSTDPETYDMLIKSNTVAIMFPYIRSQVSILTTQPGIQPIMIPPMNINAIISDSYTADN